jgi:hypothetical protein
VIWRAISATNDPAGPAGLIALTVGEIRHLLTAFTAGQAHYQRRLTHQSLPVRC